MTPTPQTASNRFQAIELVLTGRVQGVGFRPFVYCLAQDYGIHGWVKNELGQVRLLAQGHSTNLEQFVQALITQSPRLARAQIVQHTRVSLQALEHFQIKKSATDGHANIHIPPDYDLCPDCLKELMDPNDRRHRYPFINCTQCGPRYSLIQALPYDRANTSMAVFPLCSACAKEYNNPIDRRFHAEPSACPLCGPQLCYRVQDKHIAGNQDALAAAVTALRDGQVIAVKGIGGYHLMCDASNDEAIAHLRHHKPRPHKPLAVMFPLQGHDGLAALSRTVLLTPRHKQQLLQTARPIVLCQLRSDSGLSSLLAPGLDELGVFLPYSPIHHLLLQDFAAPLVATSANLSGEPLLTESEELEQRLGHVAQGHVHHNRAIVRPIDDSVVRIIDHAPRLLRLGRGYAPLELQLPRPIKEPLLAVGGHMKNTVALAWEQRLVISPHIGDLHNPRSLTHFEKTIDDLQTLYRVQARRVVCDAHNAYASHRWAKQQFRHINTVWHHHAHAAAVAGEFAHAGPWLVFTWDGVGLGADGTLWGGEALYGQAGAWRRVASFRPFRLPGGEQAARQPWRSAAALCWELGLPWQNSDSDLLYQAWRRGLNSPSSSAVGRLFDAAASLIGLLDVASYEGQGPMLLEAACANAITEAAPLPWQRDRQGLLRSDWGPLLGMLRDTNQSQTQRARQFHASLVATLVAQAQQLRQELGEFHIGLSGGVFQNRVLTEHVCDRLRHEGFTVALPQRLPYNDAGLCFGQIIELMARESTHAET